MELNIKAFKLHKIGEAYENCHDNYAFDLEEKRFAIADGVSKSFFPALWSKLLVDHFMKDVSIFNEKDIDRWLRTTRKRWLTELNANMDWNNQPFFVRNRKHESAFSTFAGIDFFQNKEDSNSKALFYKAIVIGDSCLFHFRGEEHRVFNKEKSVEFDNFPICISSREQLKEDKKKLDFTPIHSTVTEGDIILLATDAVAKWVLENIENENHADNAKLLNLKNMIEFDDFIHQMKGDSDIIMEDDDTCILQINVVNKRAVKKLIETPKDYSTKHSIANSMNSFKTELAKNPSIVKQFKKGLKKLEANIQEQQAKIKERMEKHIQELQASLEETTSLIKVNKDNQVENKEVVLSKIAELEGSINANKVELLDLVIETKKELSGELKKFEEDISNSLKDELGIVKAAVDESGTELKKKIKDLNKKIGSIGSTDAAQKKITKFMMVGFGVIVLMLILGFLGFYLGWFKLN